MLSKIIKPVPYVPFIISYLKWNQILNILTGTNTNFLLVKDKFLNTEVNTNTKTLGHIIVLKITTYLFSLILDIPTPWIAYPNFEGEPLNILDSQWTHLQFETQVIRHAHFGELFRTDAMYHYIH